MLYLSWRAHEGVLPGLCICCRLWYVGALTSRGGKGCQSLDAVGLEAGGRSRTVEGTGNGPCAAHAPTKGT